MIALRRLTVASAACATALGLAACGSNEPTEQSASAPASADTQASSAESAPASSQASNAQDNGNQSDSGATLSQEEAEQIVFDDAGVTRDQVTNWDRTELDTDDSRQIWEIEFDINDTDYEYDIDATTGDIVSKEVD